MTLRTGGVSAAPYNTLNLGTHVGDDPTAVARNRNLLRTTLRLPAEPTWLDQVHGTHVLTLDSPPTSSSSTPPKADAAVTQTPNRVCVIQVADCMPVLMASLDGKVVAASHAGWRGLVGGVLENTLAAMAQPASNVIAWLGPTISQLHFEVGDEVRAAFIQNDSKAAAAFTPNERNRWQCDLYALARQRLTALGVRHISGGGWCTFADSERFFSYRRDGRCGRMAALIWLAPS